MSTSGARFLAAAALTMGLGLGGLLTGSVPGRLYAQDQNEEVAKARAELEKLGPPPRIFPTIAKIIRPSVVSVITKQKYSRKEAEEWWPFQGPNPFRGRGPDEFEMRGLGSGVIVDKDGYILTNNHVVDQADAMTVQLWDETEYEAKLVGVDPKTDLAVIKIEAKVLVPAILGDSDKLDVGESVLAFGAPFGLSQSVSAGIVSAVGRSNVNVIQHAFSYENFIQTDAAINHGNSGGPLVNWHAEVVGINTAIVTGTGGYQGVGFAIPSNLAKKVAYDLIQFKKVVRGYLGVQIRDLVDNDMETLKLTGKNGVYVDRVFPDSPAEKAGLRTGDIIVGFNAAETHEMQQLRAMVAASSVGKEAKLKVMRDGQPVELQVLIQEQPDVEPEENIGTWQDEELGMTVRTLNDKLAERVTVEGEKGVYAGEKGVLVIQVIADGPAAKAGIKQYDLVKEVANQPVENVTEYRRIRRDVNLEKGVLLLVKTGHKARIASVK